MIKNTSLILFKTISSKLGNLIPVEALKEVPFNIKRIYYIYGVPNGVTRGFHSHRNLEQVLICVHGKVNIRVKTPYQEEIIVLDNPNIGLYIGHMVWREMFSFSNDAVLVVLASEYYTEQDYIRDIDLYKKEAIEYFKQLDNYEK